MKATQRPTFCEFHCDFPGVFRARLPKRCASWIGYATPIKDGSEVANGWIFHGTLGEFFKQIFLKCMLQEGCKPEPSFTVGTDMITIFFWGGRDLAFTIHCERVFGQDLMYSCLFSFLYFVNFGSWPLLFGILMLNVIC